MIFNYRKGRENQCPRCPFKHLAVEEGNKQTINIIFMYICWIKTLEQLRVKIFTYWQGFFSQIEFLTLLSLAVLHACNLKIDWGGPQVKGVEFSEWHFYVVSGSANFECRCGSREQMSFWNRIKVWKMPNFWVVPKNWIKVWCNKLLQFICCKVELNWSYCVKHSKRFPYAIVYLVWQL
jgi:hypothetical protein